jgi:muramoyltetrapeptide carboxypeptidase
LTQAILRPGDTVGVCATGFAVRGRRLDAGVARLRRMGYRVVTARGVLSRDGYLAGDDDSRAADLAAMIDDDEVRAIWFARGGYGTSRILDAVPWRRLSRRGKALIGYSDLTALFNAAVSRAGVPCLYGPVVAELGDASSFHGPSLRALLAGRSIEMSFGARKILVPGRARGRLIGGNLTVLASLWGTRYQPDMRDRILLLEEVGEQVYRLDRMLTQLRLAGAFSRLAGVILGALEAPARKRFPPDRALGEVLLENFRPLGVPVVVDLPLGHRNGKWTVPIGGSASIDTGRRVVRFAP